jgi:hypothetical protein
VLIKPKTTCSTGYVHSRVHIQKESIYENNDTFVLQRRLLVIHPVNVEQITGVVFLLPNDDALSVAAQTDCWTEGCLNATLFSALVRMIDL